MYSMRVPPHFVIHHYLWTHMYMAHALIVLSIVFFLLCISTSATLLFEKPLNYFSSSKKIGRTHQELFLSMYMGIIYAPILIGTIIIANKTSWFISDIHVLVLVIHILVILVDPDQLRYPFSVYKVRIYY